MATLEKIRSKSVLLFIIIIVALLAFILGDFLTSGRTYFGNGTTIAKVGNQKVDYTDYQNALSAESERNQQQPNYDSDTQSQQVISQLLFDRLLEQEYKDLGIEVTDKEISNIMLMEPVPYALQGFYGNVAQVIGRPAESINGTVVYDVMKNPGKYNLPPEVGPQIEQAWTAYENQFEQAQKQQKFAALLFGLYGASELDAKALYDDASATRQVAYAVKPYSQVSDDDIEFTDDDIKAYWNKNKNQYKIDREVRDIDYIYVPITPSQADRLAGQQAVEEAIAGLKARPETDAVASDIRFVVNRSNSPARAFESDNRLKGFVDTAKVGDVQMLSNINNTYTIAKLIGTKNGVDSMYVSTVTRLTAAETDSLAALLAEGTPWAEIVDPGMQQQGFDFENMLISVETTPLLTDNSRAALAAAAAGQTIVVADTIGGQPVSRIFKVEKTTRPVTFYDIAQVKYTVDPSNETIANLNNDLRTFISANSSADDFFANAPEAGYSVQTTEISAISPNVGNHRDSRGLVKWAMEAKKGKVSPVFQDNKQSYFMVVAVRDIYTGNYLPYTANRIANRVRVLANGDKKGDKIVADVAGKASDLQGYAELLGVETSEGTANFNSPMLLNVGIYESALQGAVAAAEEGKVVGPLKGNGAVLVFEVKGTDTQNRPFDYEEYAQRFNQTIGTGRFQNQMLELLAGKQEIKNNSLDFTQSAFAE